MSGFKALTLRGRSFLASGAAALLCAVLLGEHDLLRVAVLIISMPLIAAVLVARTRYRLACTRRLDPVRIQAGESCTVTLRLENVTRLPTGLLLVEDTLPNALGARPRFVLDRVEPHGVREIDYTVRCESRGRFAIGPLSVRIADPFGLVELTRSFTITDTLVVTPSVVPLPPVRLTGEWTGGGESRTRSVAAAGDDDVAPREYRQGDDLRRVHWRSTARHGELMVRREEQQRQSRGTLLLDTRRRAHRGEGPRSSLEVAVSAAASIGVHLSRDGLGLRLVTDQGGQPLADSGGSWSLLDALAVVRHSSARSLEHAITALHRGGADDLIVAVLGSIDAADAQALARLRQPGVTGIAVLLEVFDGLDEQITVDNVLTAGGWRVLRLPAGASLASVWPEVAHRRVGIR